MAILRHKDSNRDYHLPVDAMVGRGAWFDVPLLSSAASVPHALIRWNEDGSWHLRDLGSKNGTLLGGRLVEPGTERRLQRGAAIQFGLPEAHYLLIDAGPPVALARHHESGRTVPMLDGLIVLPDEHDPVASIYEGHDITSLEIDMAPRLGPVIDREIIEINGELWHLRIASAPVPSSTFVGEPYTIDGVTLHFRADQAWQAITLTLEEEERTLDVRHYAHHELLLVLANERVREQEAGGSAGETGWLNVEEVCRRVNRSEAVLNVLVHKARQRFQQLGVIPPADVIERRPSQMRIGVENIVLHDYARHA